MISLVKVDSTGKILSHAKAPEDVVDLYLADGFIEKALPDDPAMYLINNEWVLPLSVIKEAAKARITRARDTEERNGFLAYGKVFDSDAIAIQRISLAVQAAQSVGNAFVIEWTCADNSTITLDYDQILSLPVFMATAANALHVKARTLKAAIDSAQTIGDIEAIQWN